MAAMDGMDPHNRLAGATVVVTRPAASAAPIKSRVRQLGGTPLSLPGTTLRKAADAKTTKTALLAAKTSDIVVFVSPAAVKYAFALAKLRFPRTALVCAMGEATARALRRRGLKNVIVPIDTQNSEGLLALPELKRLRGKRVTIIGAPGGRELLAT